MFEGKAEGYSRSVVKCCGSLIASREMAKKKAKLEKADGERLRVST